MWRDFNHEAVPIILSPWLVSPQATRFGRIQGFGDRDTALVCEDTDQWKRREHPVSKYIVDFYCHVYRLAIELDGKVHDDKDQKERDLGREEDLKLLGIHILRLDNQLVVNQTFIEFWFINKRKFIYEPEHECNITPRNNYRLAINHMAIQK